MGTALDHDVFPASSDDRGERLVQERRLNGLVIVGTHVCVPICCARLVHFQMNMKCFRMGRERPISTWMMCVAITLLKASSP
jgi:hypothetical protein